MFTLINTWQNEAKLTRDERIDNHLHLSHHTRTFILLYCISILQMAGFNRKWQELKSDPVGKSNFFLKLQLASVIIFLTCANGRILVINVHYLNAKFFHSPFLDSHLWLSRSIPLINHQTQNIKSYLFPLIALRYITLDSAGNGVSRHLQDACCHSVVLWYSWWYFHVAGTPLMLINMCCE